MSTFTVSNLIGLCWEQSADIFESSPRDSNNLRVSRTAGPALEIMEFCLKFVQVFPTSFFPLSEEFMAFLPSVCAPGLIVATILWMFTMC